MRFIEEFGLIPELAGYIRGQSARVAEPLPVAGAIAVLSWAAGGRYFVSWPSITNRSEPIRTVTQSVMLVGHSGCGKGQVMKGIQRLAFLSDPGTVVTWFHSTKSLLYAAIVDPGLMWMLQHADHHQLARLAPDDKDRLLTAFQVLQLDMGSSPPITLLAESTPTALKSKLPDWFAFSISYGSLLFAIADLGRPPLRKEFVHEPSEALVDRLRRLRAHRRTPWPVLVAWQPGAEELYRELLFKAVRDLPLGPVWAHQTLNVAALVAIGIDADRPTIEEDHVAAACELARDGFEVMKSGLVSAQAGELN